MISFLSQHIPLWARGKIGGRRTRPYRAHYGVVMQNMAVTDVRNRGRDGIVVLTIVVRFHFNYRFNYGDANFILRIFVIMKSAIIEVQYFLLDHFSFLVPSSGISTSFSTSNLRIDVQNFYSAQPICDQPSIYRGRYYLFIRFCTTYAYSNSTLTSLSNYRILS